MRKSRGKNGKAAIYVRIVVTKTSSEIALKRLIDADKWNSVKGMAKPKNTELKALNSYLEETRGLLTSHYQGVIVKEELVTAEEP